MKTKTTRAITCCLTTMAGHLSAVWAARILLGLLLFALPAAVQAQFNYTTENGNVLIPTNVTTIEGWAFSGCTALTRVTIPDSVTSIGGDAFWSCSGLTNIMIGKGVTSIGIGAFSSCSSLTGVTIPNDVATIAQQVFVSCANLNSVTIGNRTSNIGSGAFAGCTSLTGVHFQGNAPSVAPDAFWGANSATAYHLPGTTGWGATFAGRPTALWSLPYPVILSSGPSFGVDANGFGFPISWATNASVVVEASPNLATPAWVPVTTNTLTGGTSQFTDPQWTNYPTRLYRLVSPQPVSERGTARINRASIASSSP